MFEALFELNDYFLDVGFGQFCQDSSQGNAAIDTAFNADGATKALDKLMRRQLIQVLSSPKDTDSAFWARTCDVVDSLSA